MSASQADVIIIGGGVIGCSIAYNLAKAQVKSLIIEKAAGVGQEASRSGAGILASHASTREPYAELCRASLALYPSLAKQLEAETQIDIEFIQSGSIAVFSTDAEKKGLISLAERRVEHGFSAEALTAAQVWEFEPTISKAVAGGVRFPHDAQVRSAKLSKALAKGAAQLGTQFLFGNPVTAFLRKAERVVGVEVNGEAYYGETIVIAAGCWSGKIAGLLGYSLPIEPVRGQIVLTETMPLPLRHIIDGFGVYLVPRADGKILIGATVEFVGYDNRITLGGIREMIEAGTTLMPTLAEKSFVQAWSGLRPYTKGVPFLGKLPGFDNVIVASGHYKNGILLSPITGKLICELIMTGCPSVPLQPFRLD